MSLVYKLVPKDNLKEKIQKPQFQQIPLATQSNNLEFHFQMLKQLEFIVGIF